MSLAFNLDFRDPIISPHLLDYVGKSNVNLLCIM
jgi:hypothetical protein